MSDFGSPFATAQTHTYKLSEPLPQVRIGEDGLPVRDGNGELVLVDIDYAEAFGSKGVADDYWIRLRLPTSRADTSALQDLEAPLGSGQWRRDVFLRLCEAWSIDPDVKGDDYDRLQSWVYTWIDACVLDAYQRGIAGRAEKKGGGSSKPRTSRARSVAAAA